MHTTLPSRQIRLAVPLAHYAGVQNRHLGAIDFFGGISPAGALLDIGGKLFGGLFGGNQQDRQLKAHRKEVEAQLRAATEIARLQSETGNRMIDAAVQTERIRAANELAAIDAAYSAHLSSQRTQKAVAQEALSAQLVSQSTSGIFGLARTGLEQSGSVARAYPKSAAWTLVALVAVSALAISYMKSGKPKVKSPFRRRRGRRSSPPAQTYYSPAPSPSPLEATA